MRKFIIILLFVIVSITWGTTWLAMAIVIKTIPPFFATGIRFLSAVPTLILIAFLNKTPLLFPPGKRFFQFMISIFYFAVPFSLMLYSGLYVNVYLSSIIFSSMPSFILIVSYFVLNKKIFFFQKIGLFITVITFIFILYNSIYVVHDCFLQGIIALMIAVISHAIIYVQCKKRHSNISVLTFNTLPSLIAGIILLIGSFIFEHPIITQFSLQSILAIIYLGNFSGIFGIISYFYLQKQVNSFYASIVFLIFPFIAISLDYYFFYYTISLYQFMLIILFCLGIVVTLSSNNFKIN
ncbi:DMT family transporter [Buchnera aphidicola (Formosaphis micheliae)]|uniref:DMT family transporter n=1 Tax=Buchnera aphidicola TaxID=9 RepID=UPI0031CCCADB